MSIQEIKEKLSIKEVLEHYQIPVKKGMVNCPFHEDGTPSMQVFEDSNSVRCYSGNCEHSNQVIDVIDFIMFYEKLSKSEAIKKSEEMAGLEKVESRSIKLESCDFRVQDSDFLTRMFEYFKLAVFHSQPAREYLKVRSLNYERLEIGYNSGQFHHGQRKDPELIQKALQAGLLLDKGYKNNRTLEKAYTVFGNKSLVFPLKNKSGEIVSFYFRAIENKEQGHYYLKDRKGLYPEYPQQDRKILILTESVIDASSLVQIEEIQSTYSVLACYGVNGFTEEHRQAVANLTHLKEVIIAFDSDNAGKKATEKLAKELQTLKPEIIISYLDLPSKDVNEVLQLHSPEIFTELIKKRVKVEEKSTNKLEVRSMNKLEERSTNKLEEKSTNLEERSTNLEDSNYVVQTSNLNLINELIEQSGIIGEENTRLLLFIIASSYKTSKPLHAIVQGSSGSGKTHVISKIADLMPKEDVLRFTRITESSLYNWGEFDLVGKCIVIEDLDGLKEEALFAFRELISNRQVSSGVSVKDKKGNIRTVTKWVRACFSSLSATTKGEIYEDNMSRSFVLAVDESQEQSQKIINYQNKKYAGQVSTKLELESKKQLQDYIRSLQDLEVINPFATQLQLPKEVHKIRRLNEMYQSVIKQVTFLNQKQRSLKNGCIYTEKEDLQQATEILFESIILKIDELDGSLRQFYERLKTYVKSKDKEFTQREIRQSFNLSKSQIQRYINSLLELEYIKQSGGFTNKGIRYKIDYWDNFEKLRKQIKEQLQEQIQRL